MKGIILAGGNGTRLLPLTIAVSKQLLPVYDKPLIYYPLATLMQAGIRDVLIISSPADLPSFERVLGNGSDLGMRLSYAEQARPVGIADAFLVGSDFVGDEPVALILGDNVFHGARLPELVRAAARDLDGCVLFGYHVADPRQFGIAEKDAGGRLVGLEEKPEHPRGSEAVTGLYLYTPDVVDIARSLRPSARGELEITDVNRAYLAQGRAELVSLGPGHVWIDAGTHEGLLDAAQYVRTVQRHENLRIACLEEIALRMGHISPETCRSLGSRQDASGYGQYVLATAG
ncbi:Glucose-1-phosphate thymidylyltransferase 1 [Actinomadura rubteroloni]|uniref:Glucose-1-phosphate thymidylyltransferase n=1 Tax=Actinomadura rubteroloni TaxID=1926885 RepID=A0A2P4UCQ2_9ACTN|nr:glucose-1-phosphate thymidylyltransferase RfbA [Actinomadura rubteroloni]POM22825.1 Glucose-1-phosphate thymidylyltransferase 1 [Actinomadura rubteroloni]